MVFLIYTSRYVLICFNYVLVVSTYRNRLSSKSGDLFEGQKSVSDFLRLLYFFYEVADGQHQVYDIKGVECHACVKRSSSA